MLVYNPELTSYILKLMLILVLVSTSVPSQMPSSQTPCFSVLFERDRRFVGREDIIAKIDEKFEVYRRVALAGIGGVE